MGGMSGSATDSYYQPPGTYLTAPGMAGPAGPISGSATDGMRIAPMAAPPPPAATGPLHGWWDTPAVAAPAAAAPAPAAVVPDAPAPVAPPPAPAAPGYLGPGGPIDQPTSLGNQLAGAVLTPPTYGTKPARGSGSLRTTQT